jgi:predicted RNase H-like HicB family nuclease
MNLLAKIENATFGGYIAYCDSIKGLVEHGESPTQALKELLVSLRFKLAYDFKLDFNQLTETEHIPFELYSISEKEFDHQSIVEKQIPMAELAH